MQEKDIIIKAEHVCKEYFLGNIDSNSFLAELKSRGNSAKADRPKLQALQDVSFEIARGEAVGIIGANGAGKSTLLKILSRITSPTSGRVCLDGSISSMLEVGTGFHPELTGRENIYINGTILGMTRKEIDAKLEEIIEFSECKEFIDTPVKRYSSGMYVKLAFSVAACLDSEIMILDEVLSVGDVKFQNKCLNKIEELSRTEGRTVLCVSHNMNTISRFCQRCIVLEHGKILFDGKTDQAIRAYFGEKQNSAVYGDYSVSRRFPWLERDEIRLQSAEYLGKEENVFYDEEVVQLSLIWRNNGDVTGLGVRVEVLDLTEHPVTSAWLYDFYSGRAGETGQVEVEMDIRQLKAGEYRTIYTFFTWNGTGETVDLDCISGLEFEKRTTAVEKIQWRTKAWGCMELPALREIRK